MEEQHIRTESQRVKEALRDPEMKRLVMDYIFGGDPEAKSPLLVIRNG